MDKNTKNKLKENEEMKQKNEKATASEITAEVSGEEIVIQKKKRLSNTNISQLVAHCINELISIFVSTFLISYIYSVSNNYMLDIGLFYVFLYLSMTIFYLIVSKLIVKTNRIIFYRIALIVKASFILLIIFLGQDLAKLVMLAGSLYGFSEACYFCSYNLMKNELVRKSQMRFYSTLQQVLVKMVAIVGPIVLGTIIDAKSFNTSAIVVVSIVVVQFIVSFFIKSNRPEGSCFDLKQFFKDINKLGDKKKLITNGFGLSLLYGFTTAVGPLNTILIMLVYNSNVSLGIISAIASFSSVVVIICLGKFAKSGKNTITYALMGALQLLATIMLLFNMNKTTIIIFNLIYGGLHYSHKYSFDVCRNVVLKRLNMYDSIDEYQAMIEVILQLARMTMFGFIAIGGAIGIAVGGTEALVVATKILSIVSMLAVLTLNILLGLYEKKLVKHNIL